MNPRVGATAFARLKLVNGVVFVGLGIFILARTVRGTGLDWRGISAYALAAALVALGITRLVTAWKLR
ncbi:MAG: hypothetical protein ACREML_00285 [Vulcanimicrobiaceae bacterium]